jgi:ribosome-binding factor A
LPRFVFQADQSFDQAQRIDALLREDRRRPAGENGDER